MNTTTHAQIAEHAHHLWLDGSFKGSDTEIWLEAERQLTAGFLRPTSPVTDHLAQHPLDKLRSDAAVAQQAANQKQVARAPKLATHTGPRVATPTSGKPIWSKPHSS